jgi:hypothetical protein
MRKAAYFDPVFMLVIRAFTGDAVYLHKGIKCHDCCSCGVRKDLALSEHSALCISTIQPATLHPSSMWDQTSKAIREGVVHKNREQSCG